MLIECPECGQSVSNKANSCPNCAYPLKEEKKIPEQKGEGCFLQTLNFDCVIVVIVIIGLFLLMLLNA